MAVTPTSASEKARKLRSRKKTPILSHGKQTVENTPQRRAFLSAVKSLEQVESPGMMHVVTVALSQALPQAQKNQPVTPRSQDLELEWKALQRAFEFRRTLLQDTVSTTQVSELLNVSRQAINDRERKGHLLGIMEGGQLRFPLWQFDPAGPGGVLPGLPQVLKALDENGETAALAKAAWFRNSNSALGGAAPLEVLRAGRLTEVLAAARGVGLG